MENDTTALELFALVCGGLHSHQTTASYCTSGRPRLTPNYIRDSAKPPPVLATACLRPGRMSPRAVEIP